MHQCWYWLLFLLATAGVVAEAMTWQPLLSPARLAATTTGAAPQQLPEPRMTATATAATAALPVLHGLIVAATLVGVS
jgi:hypothetical protein